jgi:alpha-glucuronidase
MASTPDELLLFFHHVPYAHVLKSGKTVMQHVFDAHYQGAADAAQFVERWRRLDGLIDADRHASVLAKLEYQAGHAIVWRDAINNWFSWISGMSDAGGRVGRFPGRIEAESASLEGFSSSAVTPWETASAGLAAACRPDRTCIARFRFQGAAGLHDIVVQYFDENDGASRFALSIAGRVVDSWTADADFGSASPNGHTSTRRTTRGVQLNPGDEIAVEVRTDGGDSGAVDYVEISTD